MRNRIKKVAAVVLSAGMITTSSGLSGSVVQAADFSSTQDLTVNTGMQGSINKGYGYGSNTYRVTLPVAGSLTVNFARPQQKDKNGYWKVKLYNEDYTEIDSEVMYGNARSTDMTTEGLPAGAYYIDVESTSYSEAASNDTYTVTAKYEQSGYWEKEFNESFRSANDITVNTVYSGTTRSGYGYEADYYRFKIDKSGMYEIHMLTPQQGTKNQIWNMRLYDDGYAEVAEAKIYGNKTDHMISASLSEGTYYIGVTSTSYSYAVSADAYQIRIGGNNGGVNGEYELDDSIGCDPADDAANTGNAQIGGGGQTYDDNTDQGVIEVGTGQEQTDQTESGNEDKPDGTVSDVVGGLLTIVAEKSVLEVGEDQILDVELPDGYDGSDLVWDTSDDEILDVDDDGVVTAVAPGHAAAMVSTEDGRLAGICALTVKMPRVTIAKVKGKGRAITIEWNRPAYDVDGYQIQYSYKKDFVSARSVYAKDGKDIYKKISGLKKNKRVYVRIRAYAKVSGSKYMGEWSKVKSARTRNR